MDFNVKPDDSLPRNGVLRFMRARLLCNFLEWYMFCIIKLFCNHLKSLMNDLL